MKLDQALEILTNLKNNISNYVLGQDKVIEEMLCCFFARGHLLITGAPGLAKTTLIKVMANFLNLNFSRVQFTPDLLPSDIIGVDILNIDPTSSQRSFKFSPGPIFTNILLADEINRASPRTQSALLEAMEELSCTVSGKTYPLDPPFMVFATQNPYESEGTYYLPEAELDRFLIHTLIDYPDEVSEENMLKKFNEDLLFKGERRSIVQKEDITEIFSLVTQTKIDDVLIKATTELVRSSRPKDALFNAELKDYINYGVSPRGGLSLLRVAKVFALMDGEESVRWKHIVRMAPCVLRHRIKLTSFARRENISEDDIVSKLLSNIEHKYNFILKE